MLNRSCDQSYCCQRSKQPMSRKRHSPFDVSRPFMNLYNFIKGHRTSQYIKNVSESFRTPQNVSEHLRTSQNVSERLRTSQNVSERLRMSQNVSERLRTSKNVSERLRTSQNVSERLRTSQNVSERLRTSQNVSETSLSVKSLIPVSMVSCHYKIFFQNCSDLTGEHWVNENRKPDQ
jgi:hypothetical protein